MSLVDIWQAIANACSNLTGVNCTAYEPAEPTVPALFPLLSETGTYTNAFAGDRTVDMTVTIRLLLTPIDELVRTENLLPYLDPVGEQSVKAVLEADPTLAGTVEDIAVTGWSNLGQITYGAIPYLGVDFTAELMVAG